MSAENRQLFGEPPERLDEAIELATRQKFIQATEAKRDALLDLAGDPHVVDDQQINSGTVGLSANEQGGDPMSPSCTLIQSNNKAIQHPIGTKRDTTF